MQQDGEKTSATVVVRSRFRTQATVDEAVAAAVAAGGHDVTAQLLTPDELEVELACGPRARDAIVLALADTFGPATDTRSWFSTG